MGCVDKSPTTRSDKIRRETISAPSNQKAIIIPPQIQLPIVGNRIFRPQAIVKAHQLLTVDYNPQGKILTDLPEVEPI
jgi:hypothetical protein